MDSVEFTKRKQRLKGCMCVSQAGARCNAFLDYHNTAPPACATLPLKCNCAVGTEELDSEILTLCFQIQVSVVIQEANMIMNIPLACILNSVDGSMPLRILALFLCRQI
jgi:hypothetical protein